jgi:hypothetical protein
MDNKLMELYGVCSLLVVYGAIGVYLYLAPVRNFQLSQINSRLIAMSVRQRYRVRVVALGQRIIVQHKALWQWCDYQTFDVAARYTSYDPLVKRDVAQDPLTAAIVCAKQLMVDNQSVLARVIARSKLRVVWSSENQ